MFLICRYPDFLLLQHLESILASPPIFVLFSLFHDDSNIQFHLFPWFTPNTNPEPSAENIEEQWWVVMKQSNKQVRITVKQFLKSFSHTHNWGFLTCFLSQNSWPPAMVISPCLSRFFSHLSSLPASNPAHSDLFHVHLDLSSLLPCGSSQQHPWSSTIKHTHVRLRQSLLSVHKVSTLCLKVAIFRPLYLTPPFSSSNHP